MLAPCNTLGLQPWDYVNSVHTTSSMIHLMPEPKPLLFCSSEICVVCVSDSSYASIFKVRYKNENSKMAEKPLVGFYSVTGVLSSLFSVFAPFCPLLPPVLQVFPSLINANLCSLTGTKPAGRGSSLLINRTVCAGVYGRLEQG